MNELIVKTPAFKNEGLIPKDYTGYGEDISPELRLQNIDEQAKSIAIIMNDMGHPIPAYNHWVIWNIPVMEVIPANIPHGKTVEILSGAVYRGAGIADIDTKVQNHRSTGLIGINSIYTHWIACWICQPLHENGTYLGRWRDIYFNRQYWSVVTDKK